MKVAIISDLHSNSEALEAVLEHIRAAGVERVYCLGDVVGYGPEPERCVDLVRERAQICLMGNHDEALFRDASDFNPHARGAIEFTRDRMEPHWYSAGFGLLLTYAGRKLGADGAFEDEGRRVAQQLRADDR